MLQRASAACLIYKLNFYYTTQPQPWAMVAAASHISTQVEGAALVVNSDPPGTVSRGLAHMAGDEMELDSHIVDAPRNAEAALR